MCVCVYMHEREGTWNNLPIDYKLSIFYFKRRIDFLCNLTQNILHNICAYFILFYIILSIQLTYELETNNLDARTQYRILCLKIYM